MAELALPYNLNAPTSSLKSCLMPLVTSVIRFQFGLPEIQSRFRHPRQFASGVWMPVPEATVNEDHYSSAREHDVGAARQPAVVKAVAQPCFMKGSAHTQFGPRVLSPHPRHLGAPLRIQAVIRPRHQPRLRWAQGLARRQAAYSRAFGPDRRLAGIPPASLPIGRRDPFLAARAPASA